jgi:hypothetical protein
MAALSDYDQKLDPVRQRFARESALASVMTDDVDPALLEAFLIHFCALGVGMTEPVEGWIRRAGERSEALGAVELGRALQKHARHEAGHHEMMISDTRKLVDKWNQRRKPPLDADALLATSAPPGVRSYQKLHEDVIAGPTPYAQVAIEYEIEALSERHGAPLLGHCAKILGADTVHGLSFLEEHVAVDVGHTKFNASQLNGFLKERPDGLAPLVTAGTAALDTYAAFLGDCLRLARETVEKT